MKAILINPFRREVYGIEFDPSILWAVFKSKSKIPIDIGRKWLPIKDHVLYIDSNAVLKFPADFFYIDGWAHPFFGKGLVVYQTTENNNPGDTPLRAGEINPLVGFHSPVPNRTKRTYRSGEST